MNAPPVEHYVRCSVLDRDAEVVVEPGLELREGDDFREIGRELRGIAWSIGRGMYAQPARPRIDVCRDAAARFEARWPGRAWFVELHDPDHDLWTQSYQPYGIPRNQ